MIQLRCTRKVMDQFRIPRHSIFDPEPTDATLGNWYVNLTTISRRKTLIFMSERTLLSFLLFGVRKQNSKNLCALFFQGLTQLLEFEGFSVHQIGQVLGHDRLITVSKTDNRKALGNLNDIQKLYEYRVHDQGGLEHCDLWEIIHSMNRMPQRNIGWGYSIELTRELIGQYECDASTVGVPRS